MFAPLDRTLIFRNPFRSCITEREVLDAQKAWGDALVDISVTYDEKGWEAAKARAEEIIDAAYGYNVGPVLFKPTLTIQPQTFRTTHESALAYFVGGNKDFPNDTGFALKGWRNVEIVNSAIFREGGNLAVTMGNVILTDKSGQVTTVDKTWAFYKGRDRKVRIVAHHSSLPHTG
eukprot:CAMPEP_0179036826 /NCGR_PEP_ID=MMETSP0796-20121207/13813_1 /TAXON_ID=73915 /ORGANISM="Pyrodinium bahamense, Strain pbaha01" /LENGTH=174 /DNA_ID=CAMNT_0020733115 /DNA_START=1 /DNA_END=525 /DNA_ORIENTATION=-